MPTPKTVNYTPEAVAHMVKEYSSAASDSERKATVQALASELGKTVKSVIAKLSREMVYVKATPVTKTGSKIETKSQIVSDIELMSGDAELTTLVKASKADLEKLRSFLETL